MPVHRKQIAAGAGWRLVIGPQPPVLAGMVVCQQPHHIAVVIHIDYIRLINGVHCLLAVPQRVVHIPACVACSINRVVP